MKRFAVVGSGIAGLAAARSLAAHGRVTLFEAAGRFGGHSHTVDLTLEGVTHGVDTGFLVFNEKTYPGLTRLFGELSVATALAEMSFSVQARPERLEWSGCNLDTVFAQRANLARPAFWRMLADLLRFNREATALASDDSATGLAALDQPIGEFLAANRYSQAFRDWYFLPMVACIWSCPTEQMLRFPVATLIRFCHNHGLLQVTGRPQWRTVRGGARTYVNRMVESIADARLNTPVRQVRRTASGGEVSTDSGSERFDAVVLACHSDQSLALLADPSEAEREVLGAIRYHPNRAVLHTDTSVLPRRRRAWAAWNYERGE
ncbi:MAG: NAD(P)/FAD-dependent oxidoreductase, partial [Caldimonas sp.]